MKKLLFFTAIIISAAVQAGVITFDCSVNKKDAIYKAGEKIVFTIKMLEDGKMPTDKFIQYRLHHDHKVIERKMVSAAGELKIETSSSKPSWIYIIVWAKDSKKTFIKQDVKRRGKVISETVKSGIGAMIEPDKMLLPAPEPADFDEFWDKVKAELAAVPMKELERVPVENKLVNIYDIKVACAGEKPVSGYLCVPKNAKPKSCPAFVSFHGAGVHGAGKQIAMAEKGLIALDINAHGIIIGKPKKFYDDLRKSYYYTTISDTCKERYALWGRHDRDQYYFKGVYMRLMRALEYIKSQPEWDGKNLIVSGGSQGGAQVLAACALDKDVSFARCGVPGWCDLSGCLADRKGGAPFYYTIEQFKAHPEYAKCAPYYDCAYFAKRVKCPIYFNTGFMDTVCPPSSVFTAYNSVPAGVEKHMQTSPTGEHSTPHSDGHKALDDHIRSIIKK
jgi:cephalosporin-C deacetylase-like acetyl esterase